MAYMWCEWKEPLVIDEAASSTRVLLVHAPYPGVLKFDAQPSSMLSAAGPLIRELDTQGRLEEVGYLDPKGATPEFYAQLERLAAGGSLEVVCISSSTAAIEEAAKVATVVRGAAPRPPLILAGGPHEDDIDEPMATRIEPVDYSIAGDAADALKALALGALNGGGEGVDTLAGLTFRGKGALSGEGGPIWSWSNPQAPVDELVLGRPWTNRKVRFSAFGGRETLPVMISQGCAYGKCTFCAEGISGGVRVARAFEQLEGLLAAHPGAAVYFQDSIFPSSRAIDSALLPVLKDLGVEWGCQVYLPMLSRRRIQMLADHGCVYMYTGVESGAEDVRTALGKTHYSTSMAMDRLCAMSGSGVQVGLSVMLGGISEQGELLETKETLSQTVKFVSELRSRDVRLLGVYPNVTTVLPGTGLARALLAAGDRLNFYEMPRQAALEDFEDGGVGYNFWSVPRLKCMAGGLLDDIVETRRELAT